MAETTTAPNFEDFLTNFGKTLSRINLYVMTHPLVQESIQGSFDCISGFLKEMDEIVVACSEDKLLLNGTIVTGLPAVQQALIQFFEKNHLYSLTFKKGVAVEEMNSFYKLFTGKREDLKSPDQFAKFLEGENVKNITVNAAFFARMTEKGAPVEPAAASPPKPQAAKEKATALAQKLENMSLDAMIWEIIQRAVPDPEDQKKIYEIIFKQIQNSITQQVEKATHAVKQEKQKISNEQVRTESVIQTAAEGVVMVDSDGRIVMMNPIAERIYGKNYSELKGKKIDELAGDEIMITFAKDLESPSDRAISREILIQSSLATQKIIKQSTAMIENPEGKVVGMMSILNDIAKHRELQQMQDQFLANVTHELRSPLTAIKASLATIASDSDIKFTDQQKNMLSISSRNIDRLARLINDILDFAKFAEGKISLNPKPVETKALLAETIQGLQSWAQAKQIAIECVPKERVPKVMADHDRVTQVLVNLLSNAIKFTPRGGKIVLSTESSPLALKIMVKDNGPGIPKNDQDKIFSKFFQLKQTEKMDVPGTGLGLFITKKIVDLHQGQIGFESEEGAGTTFWFTLPIVPESTVRETAKKPEPPKKKGWLSRLMGGG